MIRKLRLKFVCINMTIVTIMLLLVLGAVHVFTLIMADQAVDDTMRTALEQYVEPGGGGVLRWSGGSYLMVRLNPMGQVEEVVSTDLTDPSALGDPAQLVLQAMQDGRDSGVLNQSDLRFARVNRADQTYLMFASRQAEQTLVTTMFRRTVLVGAVGFCLFLGLSLLLARWAVAPVERAWKQQRQFVADASHELKTPLTVILTNAELLEDPACGDTERRRLTDSILTMSRQMRGLTEHLLELARVDNGVPKTGLAPVDWSKTVSDQALVFEPLCFEAGLTLETRIDEGIFVRGSASHLAQVPEILLDNACKYASPGGCVLLRLVRSGSRHCLLTVSNPGAPIPEEVRRHLFERFYRADQARSRDGSYGLGLAIAQGIVSGHRGKIWVTSENGSNCFWVRLPTMGGK